MEFMGMPMDKIGHLSDVGGWGYVEYILPYYERPW